MFASSEKLSNIKPIYQDVEHLISKYAGNVPRYTSYPTAVEFNPTIDSASWESELRKEYENADTQPAALYVHLPFCSSLCYFCACNKKIEKDDKVVAPYLAAVARELEKYKNTLPNVPDLQQFHWGGGTPNFISVSATEELFGMCRDVFPTFIEGADISIEIDPRTITDQHLETYRKLGVNRISAGVQDFCPIVQKAVNRIQPYELTKTVCETVRALGFSGLNLDLIYGLPEQTEITFADTVEKLLNLRPDRIALYGYAHVTWKTKVQKSLERHTLPTPEVRVKLFLLALKRLLNAGYVYIGMDHFALPEDSLSKALKLGNLNRNFMGYSTHRGSNVLGLGVSSVSSLSSIYAQTTVDLKQYEEDTGAETFKIARGVLRTSEDQLRGNIIEDILCQGRINIAELEAKWNFNFFEKFALSLPELTQMHEDQLISFNDKELIVTEVGRLFLRNIAAPFDEYLTKHRENSAKVFSQSI